MILASSDDTRMAQLLARANNQSLSSLVASVGRGRGRGRENERGERREKTQTETQRLPHVQKEESIDTYIPPFRERKKEYIQLIMIIRLYEQHDEAIHHVGSIKRMLSITLHYIENSRRRRQAGRQDRAGQAGQPAISTKQG